MPTFHSNMVMRTTITLGHTPVGSQNFPQTVQRIDGAYVQIPGVHHPYPTGNMPSRVDSAIRNDFDVGSGKY